jgi:hypothetical protein
MNRAILEVSDRTPAHHRKELETMALTNKVRTEREQKVKTFYIDTQANIIAYLDSLMADMKDGNIQAVVKACNGRTRSQDVSDLIGRALTPSEGTSLLRNAHNMDSDKDIAAANATAELLQGLRQSARTACRFGQFAAPMSQITSLKTRIKNHANEEKSPAKITGISKKLG